MKAYIFIAVLLVIHTLLTGCARQSWRGEGAEKVKKIAIVSLFHNREFKSVDGQTGILGSTMSFFNTVSDKKDNKDINKLNQLVTFPNSTTETVYKAYADALKKVGAWRVLPHKKLLKSKAYKEYVQKKKFQYEGESYTHKYGVGNVTTYNDMVHLPVISQEKVQKRKKELSELARGLNVDGVIILSSTIGFDYSTAIGSTGTAVVNVDFLLTAYSVDGDEFIEMHPTKTEVKSDESFAVIAGNTALNEEKLKLIDKTIHKSGAKLYALLDQDFN